MQSTHKFVVLLILNASDIDITV